MAVSAEYRSKAGGVADVRGDAAFGQPAQPGAPGEAVVILLTSGGRLQAVGGFYPRPVFPAGEIQRQAVQQVESISEIKAGFIGGLVR